MLGLGTVLSTCHQVAHSDDGRQEKGAAGAETRGARRFKKEYLT